MVKIKKEVSQLFVDIYMNFNVYSQKDNILKLDDREKYLLIIYCLDRHDDDDLIVSNQGKHFLKEYEEIYHILDSNGNDFDNVTEILKDIFDEFDNFDNFDYNNLVGPNDLEIRNPYNKAEVRDIKIKLIIESKNGEI